VKCHSEEEVQQLQDIHLESLLSQYKDIQMDHCQIVNDYMQSGRRNKIIHHDEKCDDEMTARAQETFQSCSHSSSTEAYQKIRDVQEEKQIKTVLCHTLNVIENVCKADLEDCFSDEDIQMITSSHLTEMKKFLVRITRGKVEKEALDDCNNFVNEITTEETKHEILYTTTETPPTQIYEREAKTDINMQDVSPSVDPIHEQLPAEETITINEKEPEDLKHEKTSPHQPKAAYKTESESSAANNKIISSMIYLSICFACLLNLYT